jgi:uroporphyrinogen-III synthase
MLVALTRERGRNDELRRLVGSLADVVELPLTTTHLRPPSEVVREASALGRGKYQSVVVTSTRSVGYLENLRAVLDTSVEVFSVGATTSSALEARGFRVRAQSTSGAADLARFITRDPVLILAAEGGRRELELALARAGQRCDTLVCYETRGRELSAEEARRLERCDVVFIGAPSAWRVARPHVTPSAWVLVPGTTTADEVRVDHDRVLVGWSHDFPAAWEHLSAHS